MEKENPIFDSSLVPEGFTPGHIKGVGCSVKNCVYNDGYGYCTADKISVGPGYAVDCTDTVCATFKARN